MNNIEITKGDSWLWILLSILVIGVTILVYVFGVNVWAVQVLSACIGAVITIIATRLLLSKQADQQHKLQEEQAKQQQVLQQRQTEQQLEVQKQQLEFQSNLSQKQAEQQQEFQQRLLEMQEMKDKQIKTHEKKIEVYSEFIKVMWQDAGTTEELAEQEENDTIIPASIRDHIFDKLIFYLKNETIDSLRELIERYYDNNKQMNGGSRKAKLYAEITYLLKMELEEHGPEFNKDCLIKLWSSINDQLQEQKPTNKETNPIKSEDYSKQQLKEQAWHFIMWNDTQLGKLKEGVNELSLIEYGEYWRTNLVKQVGKDDIVFLFRRGHNGYVGAYKAIGWRVFYFEEGREELKIFDEEIQIITGEKYLLDIKEYDIYESKNDGATTCANIIVEPIAFVEDGVGYPGGVYRRTISRYDPHYAWQLKDMFKEKGQWKEKE